MSLVEAAVWVFWGVVALSIVRMLVRSKGSADAASLVSELRAEVKALKVDDRLKSLESGQLTLKNQVESGKVHQIGRRGVFR